MRKMIIPLALALLASAAFGQKKKFSISLLVTPTIGGPENSIGENMKEQGFGETANFNFFGLTGSANYPIKDRSGAVFLVNVTVRQKENRSLFFIAGISNQGKVSGYHYE